MIPTEPAWLLARVRSEAAMIDGAACVEAEIAHHGLLAAYVERCKAVADPATDCVDCEVAPLCRRLAAERADDTR